MALTPGTRLGPYAITAQIGVGGMGEVYRATDTKLDRDVSTRIDGPTPAMQDPWKRVSSITNDKRLDW